MFIFNSFKKYKVYLTLLLLLPLQSVSSDTTQKTSSVPSLAPTTLQNPSTKQVASPLQIAIAQLKLEFLKKNLATTSTTLDSTFGTILLVFYVVFFIKGEIAPALSIGCSLNTIHLLTSLLLRLVAYLPNRKAFSNSQYKKRIKGIFYTDISLLAFLIIFASGYQLKSNSFWLTGSIVGISLHFVMMIARNIIFWKEALSSTYAS